MFPAYGGRGVDGGGGGRGHYYHQSYDRRGRGGWRGPPPPDASGGFMGDRGGAHSRHLGGGGDEYGSRGREGRSGYRDQRERRDRGNRNEDEMDSSNARRYNDDSRRKRNRSRSPSQSNLSKRHKNRDRTRSPESSHYNHSNRQHSTSSSHGGNRYDGHTGNVGRGEGRSNREDLRSEGRHWSSQGHQREEGFIGHNNPPAGNPWVLDNNPNVNPNPFDQYHQQGRQSGSGWPVQSFQNEGNRNSRSDNDYRNRGVPRDGRNFGYMRGYDRPPAPDVRNAQGGRWGDGFDPHQQEYHRIQVSTSFPRKVFLEEVNLQSEFAFRLDTNSNPGQMNYRSIAMSQKSTYDGGVGRGIFGASQDEISKVYSKFHTFRCKMPEIVIEKEDDDVDDSIETSEKEQSSALNFISIRDESNSANTSRNAYERIDAHKDFDSFSFERQDGEMSIQEKIEYYNKEVQNQPHNIALWKEFVKFQDKVFEEQNMIFGEETDDSKKQKSKKTKNNKKVLLEKKIAILERALEFNPNSLPLHLQKMECLLELFKPRHVLTEWKKLVSQHQQSAPYWTEYLLFSSSQLLIYSNSSILNIFDTCFQKFRLMMNPQYPDFQRPKKFLLFLADITFSLSLLLKNAGYQEYGTALHQSLLEFDFYCPEDILGGSIIQNWKKISEAFEEFWDKGTQRCGESGAKGWASYMQISPDEYEPFSVTVPDSSISKFEEDTIDSCIDPSKEKAEGENLVTTKQLQKPHMWIYIESSRSKLYWLPWRKLGSDVEDCEDAQRQISSKVIDYVCPLPNDANFISSFDKVAAQFRHIVNFLLMLREDFVPHTQSVDFVCSPFLSTTLTESSSLFTEIYYWRKLIDVYVKVNEPENMSTFHHVFAAEGFKLTDTVSPNLTCAPILKPAIFDISLKISDANGVEEDKRNEDAERLKLLRLNDTKFMEMFYRILEIGLEKLDSEFSCILFEMLLRFEQKLTCTEPGNIKKRIKFVKAFMKGEKLCNAIGGYRELAMLEYFGGNQDKATALLIKTVDATVKTLECREWEQADWEKDWKLLVDLISMYRQLAELFLRNGTTENDSKAYYTLVQLGSGLKEIQTETLSVISEAPEQRWTPKTNLLLKASKSFERIMTMLIPNSDSESESTEKSGTDVYFKWGGERCVEHLLQGRNIIVEWTCCYALFQFFNKGFDAACKVYENVLGKLSSEQFDTRENYNPEIIRIHIREQLYINWCNLAARCLMQDPLMNSKFRNILSMALDEFPSCPPLLILFTDIENQTSVAGKLWRLMMNNMKQESGKVVTHWPPLIMGIGLARKIEELEHDEEVGLPCFGLGGPAVPQDTIFYKLDSMLSVAEQHPGVRNCPLVWRVHLKMLALRSREGKDVDRAKKTFYDAIRHCPSSKAIYLDGVTYFPYLLKEINDLMAEKQLLIRLPLEELDVLLELDEETGQIEKGEENSSDDNDIQVVKHVKSEENKNADKRKERESKSEGEIGDSD